MEKKYIATTNNQSKDFIWESHPFSTAIVCLKKPVCVFSEGKK